MPRKPLKLKLPFVHPPMAHQTASLQAMDHTPILFDMSDAGTGKTMVHIAKFAERRAAGAGPMLVLAPRRLLQAAWGNDIKKFAPWLTYSIARAENREKAFAAEVDIYITNVDAVNWLVKQDKKWWKAKAFSTLTIDESTAFKHPTSNRSKAVAKVSKNFTYRACLSGTPNPHSVCELWHQMLILDEGNRLGKSFYAFRSQVQTPVQVGPSANMLQWHDKPGADLAVAHLLRDVTVRHKLEDCIDLPENNTYCVEYTLSPKQLRHYQEMEVAAMAEFGDQLIVANNAAIVSNKLLQIASGAVYGEDGYHLSDNGRYELVADLVEAREHSLVAFLWQHQRDELIKEFTARGITFGVMDGSTSDRDFELLEQGYQRGEYQTLLCHPKSVAHGLTLTRGTATIWASPTSVVEWYEQFRKRVYRNSQTKKTENIVIVAPGTIDERAYDLCMGRHKNLFSMLSYMEGEK